jgi:hypothetical protein
VFGLFGALHHNSKAIIAIEPDGTQRHYGSIIEAARELVIPQSSLRGYLKPGKQPKKGKWEGWQFLYKNSQGFRVKSTVQKLTSRSTDTIQELPSPEREEVNGRNF